MKIEILFLLTARTDVKSMSNRRPHLSEISNLLEESLFKHSRVHLCSRFGFDGRIWGMQTCWDMHIFSNHKNVLQEDVWFFLTVQFNSIIQLLLNVIFKRIIVCLWHCCCSNVLWPAGGRVEAVLPSADGPHLALCCERVEDAKYCDNI